SLFLAVVVLSTGFDRLAIELDPAGLGVASNLLLVAGKIAAEYRPIFVTSSFPVSESKRLISRTPSAGVSNILPLHASLDILHLLVDAIHYAAVHLLAESGHFLTKLCAKSAPFIGTFTIAIRNIVVSSSNDGHRDSGAALRAQGHIIARFD